MEKRLIIYPRLNYLFEEQETLNKGFALHYLTLYAITVGLQPRCVFEFGTGLTTKTILLALERFAPESCLITNSMESRHEILGGEINTHPNWVQHYQGRSQERLIEVLTEHPGPYDLVLHDGSHDYNVVQHDLEHIYPRMRRYGLILVHDSQHSHCGKAMRQAIADALYARGTTRLTLPYGFGLTLIRVEEDLGNGTIRITRDKTTSPFKTELH